MTNFQNIVAAGFVVELGDQPALFGYGATEAEARADFEREMAMAGIEIVEEIPDDASGSYALESEIDIVPATAALIEQVKGLGGAKGWSRVGDIRCTDAEADAAED